MACCFYCYGTKLNSIDRILSPGRQVIINRSSGLPATILGRCRETNTNILVGWKREDVHRNSGWVISDYMTKYEAQRKVYHLHLDYEWLL